jgi:diguanylate cyclase (GGDEF)-like protein
VRVSGTVALAEIGLTSGHRMTHLVLRMDGGFADIVMDDDDPVRLKGLLDASVEVTAVAGEVFDGKMQQTGVRLHVPSFDYVKVLGRSPEDPWTLPATPMDRVLRGYDDPERTARVRVEGTLTYYRQGEMAVLQDGSRSIRVLTSQVDHLDVGDRVEALGIPFVDSGFLTLRLGQIRSMGTGAPINPPLVNWDELASGKHSFDLVSIEGTVVTRVQEQTQDVYVISTSGHLFSTRLRHPFSYAWPVPQSVSPMTAIPPGSTVRVTGVAMLESGNPYNGPVEFSLLLRSTSDVAVVTRPPWMNVRHLLMLVGLLLVAVFAVSMRAWQVERRNRRKIAGLAYLEKRRSRLLEDINNSRPLSEILERITELASARLQGAPCWCHVVNGATLGNAPQKLSAELRVEEQPIPSRSGAPLGTLHAAFDARTALRKEETDGLVMGAALATLAIETSRLYSDLVHRSEFDLLTDVQNRFSLEKFLDAQIQAAHQSAGILGLLYMDLDKFKQVNDVYGHHIGDIYLQQVAVRMKRQLRPGDLLARVGGDEFAAVVPAAHSRDDVVEIALRLEHGFDEPFEVDGHTLRGSASIGIAMYPEDGTSKDSLLRVADASMYVAKTVRHETLVGHASQLSGDR